MSSINFTGLASGLDTKALIDAIMQAERRPVDRLQARQTQMTQKRTALDEMRAKLDAFESALRGLSAETTFRAYKATTSSETYLKATAGAGAQAGLYEIEVLGLAAAHKIKSNGVAATGQGLISDGTLTIRSGTREAVTVEVSAAAGNNTLEAVRDAINAADKGVEASVLYDGTAYRLIVRSEETGTASALTVTDTTSLGLADPANQVSAASDARVKVDGIEVTSSSNRVVDVIPGVALDLRSLTPSGQPVTVEISQDKDKVTEAVQGLVTAYNQIMDFFNAQFDRARPGALASDVTARDIQFQLQSLVTGGVEGLPDGGIRSLSALGVSFDGRTGRMSLDTATLSGLLDDRFEEVGKVFIASAAAADSRVRYESASTQASAGTYAVTITRAAEQAGVTGSVALGGTLGRDETLTVTVGSATAQIALTSTMTATQVVEALNAGFRGAGLRATALLDGGRLRIQTREYGASATVSVQSDQASDQAGTGFGSTAVTDTGENVAGTIGGVAASGTGQVLTGAEGGGYTGLSLRITATAAEVAAAGGSLSLGSVSFSPGLVSALTRRLDRFTSVSDGPIQTAREGLDDTLKVIAEDIARWEDRLKVRQTRLIRMFTEAEKAISALQAQQAQFSNAIR